MGQLNLHSKTLDMLEQTFTSGLTLTMMIPDSAASVEEKAGRFDIHSAENALDEVNEKCTKTGTGFTPPTILVWTEALLSNIANKIIYMYLWYEMKEDSTPMVTVYFWKMAGVVTSKEAREWLKKNRKANPHFPYYVFIQLMISFVLYTQNTNDVVFVAKAASSWKF